MCDLRNLQTNGFTVIKNFLLAEEVEYYCRDFAEGESISGTNKNYAIRHSYNNHTLTNRINAVLDQLKTVPIINR